VSSISDDVLHEVYHLIRIFEFGRPRYVLCRTNEEGLQGERLWQQTMGRQQGDVGRL
jgi:hypothetical protein